jgi:Ala-tRNA(Pro) deacylase
VTLATEAEFIYAFPDCELGAMPPFGNLYDMEVFVAESLAEDREIAFNAGSHTEMIKLRYSDFEGLVHPQVFRFSQKEVSMPYDPSEKWVEDY